MQTTERYCMGCMRDNGGETICRFCGFNESRPHEAFALPLRSWLAGRYMTGAIKDLNGEGITYIAWDSVQQEPVFIREYFPQGFCERYLRLSGVKIHRDQAKTYDEGMDAFISLAEDLSRMGALQGLLPVRDIFEDNGTAYYAYESVESIKLKEFLLRNGGTLKWDQARPLFLSIIPTLTALHGAGILHCGISHDTLLVGRDGKMRVTGFCIEQVRNARSDFKSQLFSGYAAIEQYGFKGQIGSATDVYALGAAIYRTLVGRPPPPATERVTDDRMTIPYFIAQNLPEDV
ncbi:MAG TPA: hypothetical protein DEQ02_07480, partial [Ruminococcaceae bacterium]|nr:hypothetical protein [Oscillospiraceae bacterium]